MIIQLRLRGVFILAAGFSLGYAKAMRDSDEIRVLLQELIDELKHFPRPASEDGKAEEIVDAIEVPKPDKERQGETP